MGKTTLYDLWNTSVSDKKKWLETHGIALFLWNAWVIYGQFPEKNGECRHATSLTSSTFRKPTMTRTILLSSIVFEAKERTWMVPNSWLCGWMERNFFNAYGNETFTIYRMCPKKVCECLGCSFVRLLELHVLMPSQTYLQKDLPATFLQPPIWKESLGISSMPSLQQVLLAGFSPSIEFNISWTLPFHETPWQLRRCILNWVWQLKPTPKQNMDT